MPARPSTRMWLLRGWYRVTREYARTPFMALALNLRNEWKAAIQRKVEEINEMNQQIFRLKLEESIEKARKTYKKDRQRKKNEMMREIQKITGERKEKQEQAKEAARAQILAGAGVKSA